MAESQSSNETYYVIKAPNGEMFVLPLNDLSQFKLASVDDLPEKLHVPDEYARYTNALKKAVEDSDGLLLADVNVMPPGSITPANAMIFGVSATLVQSNYLPDDPNQASKGSSETTK